MDIGKLSVPVVANIKDYVEKMDEVAKKSQETDKKVKINFENISKAASTIAAVGIGALVASIGLAINKTVEWRNTTDDMNKALGTTNEQSAGLSLLADRVGMSSEDISGAMQKLTMGLRTAKGELGPTGLALQNLGISAFDASGNILPATDILQMVSDKLGNMPDSLNKTAIEMDLFGKSGAQMNEILGTAANGGIQDFINQAGQMGLVMSPEKSAQIEEYQRSQQKFKETMDGLAVTIGTKVIPQLTPLIEKFGKFASEVLPPLVDFITNNLIPILITLGSIITINIIRSLVTWAVSAYAVIAPMVAAGAASLAALAPIALPILAIIAAVGLLIFVITNFGKEAANTFNMIVAIIGTKLKEAWDWLSTAFTNVWNGISNAIRDVLYWLAKLGNDLLGLPIPDWLKPGSPTPFELGLIGIGKAMEDLNKVKLPEFNAQMKFSNVQNPIPINSTSNSNLDVSAIVDAINNNKQQGLDEKKLAYMIKDLIRMEMG